MEREIPNLIDQQDVLETSEEQEGRTTGTKDLVYNTEFRGLARDYPGAIPFLEEVVEKLKQIQPRDKWQGLIFDEEGFKAEPEILVADTAASH